VKISHFFYSTHFLDEDRCRRVILETLYLGGPVCPYCGENLPKERHERFFENRHNFCSKCQRKYFATTGTPFNSLKIPFKKAVMIRFLIEQGYGSNQIRRRLKINNETIRTMRKRFEMLEVVL
jgi:transposase-like protein